jgi:thioredoxin reductase
VSHALVDARAFTGQRVLVVGLGDTAMEAIIALSHQPSTQITVCHRGDGFTRGKARNIREVERLARAGRIRLVLGARVTRIGDGSVVLDEGGSAKTLTIDRVLVLIGGVPTWDLLERAGVRRGPTRV